MLAEKISTMSTYLRILIIPKTSFILLFLACFYIATQSSAQEYYDDDDPPLPDLDLDRLEKSLRKLNINEKTTIYDLVPEIANELSQISKEELSTVYSKYFIDKDIDVFELPVIESTKQFYKALCDDPEERQFLDLSDYDKKAQAFVESLKQIARTINKSVKKPKNQRLMVGLAPQAALTKEEFEKLRGFRAPT